MSFYHPHRVSCSCGHVFSHSLVKSANVERSPAIRQAALEGTLHRLYCPGCGQQVVVESKFFFADPQRNSLFMVKPSNQRFRSQNDSEELALGLKAFPEFIMDRKLTNLRVVYGLDELREKLVCQDANLDDRQMEVAKLYILRDHPFLMKRNRLFIHLAAVRDGMMHFVAGHKNNETAFTTQLPISLLEELTTKLPAPEVKKVTAKKTTARKTAKKHLAAPGFFDQLGQIFGGGGKPKTTNAGESNFWVNFRSLSNRNEAKAALQTTADAIKAGRAVPLSGAEFDRMISLLEGNAASLDSASKQNLQVLFDYAVRKGNDRAQERLTEVRFGVPLDDEWSTNAARGDIPVIWRVLAQLPASNVVGNVSLKRIDVEGIKKGGVYGGGVITIFGGTASATTGSGLESYEDTLRHEVGHAVHWRRKDFVDAWLRTQFGWEEFQASTAGVLAWASKMGAAAWPAGTSAALQQAAANVLVTSLPASGWNEGPIRAEAATPAVRAVLAHPDCGVAKAWKQSGSNWFQQCDEWFTAGDKAFFINFYFRTFMCVNKSTISTVLQMPSRYAAMSPPEFFAELYALWYDPEDPQKNAVPQSARTWFAANVG